MAGTVPTPFSPQGGPRSVHSEHPHSPSRAEEDGEDYVSDIVNYRNLFVLLILP